jgi:cation diffusion facilitator family transporter
MSPKKISILSVVSNILLTIFKFFIGFLSHSVALIAEALHSGLDIAASLITYLGVSKSEKPADKKHPYGHGGYEGIASFLIAILLFISAFLILYESISNFILHQHPAQFTIWGIFIMAISTITNEVLARLKFKSGTEFSSLAVISDAEHSQADVASSLAVLIGLFLVKYYSSADNILAILVAFYILYEAYSLSREAVGSLIDEANPELEGKIKKYLDKESVVFSDLKTRKIGASNFAEMNLFFNPETKAEEISKEIKIIQQKLLQRFPELKQVSLSVESHDFTENITRTQFGERFRFYKNIEKIGPPKPVLSKENKVRRLIVPIQGNEISPDFGAEHYLLIDLNDQNHIIQKSNVKNPFFEKNKAGHGTKFARLVSADQILVKKIGDEAKANLKRLGIEVKILEQDKTLKDLNL